jgi:hypothetical protein
MLHRKAIVKLAGAIILAQGMTVAAQADDGEDLAKKLANPVASLISVPLQYNYDSDFGPEDDGTKQVLNVQPVVPISLGDDWNLISRTIVPLVHQEDIPDGNDETGIGDVLQSAFFSPKQPTAAGIIWGVGPALLLPTATDDTLGGEKWAIGPTAVGLTQDGPWTLGVLANHLWSFSGESSRNDINATFLQPFVTYITSTKTTFALNTETTYDWDETDATIPVNFVVSQLFKVGDQPMQIGVGPRYWITSASGGPEGLGVRAVFTLLFPK